MKEIPLTRGCVALVDDDDYDLVSKFKWCALKKSCGMYAMRGKSKDMGVRLKNTKYPQSPYIYMHRMILQTDGKVDHINGNTLDNRKSNLREATQSQNTKNRRGLSGKTSKGVGWNKQRKKWRARITVDYKSIYLGCFDNFEDACKAYDAAALKYHGEFAKLNSQLRTVTRGMNYGELEEIVL